MRFYILAMLPAFVCAKIQLSILQYNSTTILDIEGEDRSIITDDELEIFGITDELLKNCSDIYLGGYPTDVFIRSPTPWKLYKKYGWIQTRRILKPISWILNAYNTTQVLLKSNFLTNNDLETIIFKGNVTYEVTNLKTKWRENETVTDYNVEVVILNGKNDDPTVYKAKNYTIKSEIDIIVNPGQELAIELFAIETKIATEVTFEISLSGNMIMNFEKSFRGHHFYAPNIEDVMYGCSLETKLNLTADLELNFYEKPRLVIRDKDNKIVILNKELTD